jgi:F-type H+-transporting ATPase subunit gamma
MATLKQIRGRIKAAKNIQQITRAMKLVAAARLKRATERALAARPYSEKLREVVGSLSSAGDLPDHPLLKKGQGDDYGLILVTAERGLCGSYNTNLIRTAQNFMRESASQGKIIAVGKKGSSFFARRGFQVVHTVHPASAGATLDDALEVAKMAQSMFESGEIARLYICYSKFYSAIRQVPQVAQLLPIEPPGGDATAARSESHSSSYAFEPDSATLLHALLPRYFVTNVWQALLEATASEFGARMSAMTSATDNAGKMIHSLTLKANRERQAAITKEILEVVGGAEALRA